MLIEVKVPQLSESVSEATLLAWHKKQGEAVKRDENLIDIETDKVVLELPSPVDGVLVSILKGEKSVVGAGEAEGRDADAGAAGLEASQERAPRRGAFASRDPQLDDRDAVGEGVEAADVIGMRVARDHEVEPVDAGVAEERPHRAGARVAGAGGEALVVSQFTLLADTRKGNRPSFTAAAAPEAAEPLVARVVESLRAEGIRAGTGRFGAMMEVELVNDGPVTIVLDV